LYRIINLVKKTLNSTTDIQLEGAAVKGSAVLPTPLFLSMSTFVFLAGAPPFGSLLGEWLWWEHTQLNPFADNFPHQYHLLGGHKDTFLYLDSIFSTFPLPVLSPLSPVGPRSIQSQEPFVWRSLGGKDSPICNDTSDVLTLGKLKY
jgi:hypothetical protein